MIIVCQAGRYSVYQEHESTQNGALGKSRKTFSFSEIKLLLSLFCVRDNKNDDIHFRVISLIQ